MSAFRQLQTLRLWALQNSLALLSLSASSGLSPRSDPAVTGWGDFGSSESSSEDCIEAPLRFVSFFGEVLSEHFRVSPPKSGEMKTAKCLAAIQKEKITDGKASKWICLVWKVTRYQAIPHRSCEMETKECASNGH